MTSNIHSVPQDQASSVRSLGKAISLAVTILVWFFAATFETGYVAVLNSGIQ
jgi:hypothetical protein